MKMSFEIGKIVIGGNKVNNNSIENIKFSTEYNMKDVMDCINNMETIIEKAFQVGENLGSKMFEINRKILIQNINEIREEIDSLKDKFYRTEDSNMRNKFIEEIAFLKNKEKAMSKSYASGYDHIIRTNITVTKEDINTVKETLNIYKKMGSK